MGNQGGVYCWSQTPANNATADETVNWEAGMAPSAVSPSARAMMTSVAKYRDDISGAILTTGTSTQYIIGSNQVFDTAPDFNFKTIAFRPHATNGAGPVTITVDGFANLPLRSAPNVELPAGVLVEGTPYEALYNNADGALYLKSFFGASPYLIPLAGGLDFWGSTAPNSSFAFPMGQAISRATYATLFAIMGTTYGAGDGSTTFNLPDKTGRVSAMLEPTAGGVRLTSAGGGVVGSTIGANGGNQVKTLTQANLPNVAPTFSGGTDTVSGAISTASSLSGGVTVGGTGGGIAFVAESSAGVTVVPTGAVSSINGNVTQTNVNGLPPLIVCNYIIRII